MEDVHFQGQKPGEVLLSMFHKSFVAYMRDVSIAVILLVLAIAIGIYVPSIIWNIFIIAAIIALIILWRAWYLWSHNLFLITSLRVISLNRRALFRQELKESYLEDICQVTANINGILHTSFNFGDILVQTEGEQWLKDISMPYEAKEAIYDAVHQSKHPTKLSEEANFWKLEKK